MQSTQKVGIVTLYYNSTNYGGNLQAYALCKVINDYFHMDAEQISYSFSRWSILAALGSITPKKILDRVTGFAAEKRNRISHSDVYENLRKRNAGFARFNQEMIPHSEKVYTNDTIQDAGDKYDFYIAGSDQVWYPGYIGPAYTLGFVAPDKVKFSYAASISNQKLNSIRRKLMKDSLAGFRAVSVREEDTIGALSGLTDKEVQCVADPTLLLTEQDWNSIAEKRKIDCPYLFCYFLTDNEQQRNLAKEYGKTHNLKLVTIPYLMGKYRACDDGFGDIQLYDVSPEGFISLIKYADCIFTDSFHGTAFSTIYRKNYFSFGRGDCRAMNSRLYSLTKLTDKECRFCDSPDKICIEYVEKIEQQDSKFCMDNFEKMRSDSLKFLEYNLGADELLPENQRTVC